MGCCLSSDTDKQDVDKEDGFADKGHPVCKCKAKLEKVTVQDVYEGWADCNKCNKKQETDAKVYHCAVGPSPKHVRGYDLCEECVTKQGLQHLHVAQYVVIKNALIQNRKRADARRPCLASQS